MQETNLSRLLFALELTAIGMSVVFLSLLFLQFFINIIGWVERLLTGRATPVPERSEAAEPQAAASGIPPEQIAVITAAVAQTLGENVKIHHIQMLQEEEQSSWARIGRLDIMRSHNTHGK